MEKHLKLGSLLVASGWEPATQETLYRQHALDYGDVDGPFEVLKLYESPPERHVPAHVQTAVRYEKEGATVIELFSWDDENYGRVQTWIITAKSTDE